MFTFAPNITCKHEGKTETIESRTLVGGARGYCIFPVEYDLRVCDDNFELYTFYKQDSKAGCVYI